MEPIVGFRAWVCDLGTPILRSVAMRYEWPVGEASAKCMNGSPLEDPKHPAPDSNCRCGLHARTTLEGITEEYPYYPVHGYWAYRSAPTSGLMCMGAVLMWGDIARGKRVIRSQFARVLCMTDKPNLWAPRTGSNDPSKISEENVQLRAETIERVCAAYGVPMIAWAHATAYASEFGELSSESDEPPNILGLR